MATVTHLSEEIVTSVTEIHNDITLNAIIPLQSKRMFILSPYIRLKKVLEIRHKLAEDKYEINKLFDIAIEKLLDDLFTEVAVEPTEHQCLCNCV